MNSLKNNENELCKCELCGYEEHWNDSNIWSCEKCGTLVCATCMKEFNPEAKTKPISHLDEILCKSCFKEN